MPQAMLARSSTCIHFQLHNLYLTCAHAKKWPCETQLSSRHALRSGAALKADTNFGAAAQHRSHRRPRAARRPPQAGCHYRAGPCGQHTGPRPALCHARACGNASERLYSPQPAPPRRIFLRFPFLWSLLHKHQPLAEAEARCGCRWPLWRRRSRPSPFEPLRIPLTLDHDNTDGRQLLHQTSATGFESLQQTMKGRCGELFCFCC